MENILKLLQLYSKESHIEVLGKHEECLELKKIYPIYSKTWGRESAPYIVLTHLLDSYYCLPERPDIAFPHLWMAINNSYNKHFMKKFVHSSSYMQTGDAINLDRILDTLSNDLNVSFNYKSRNFTIIELIELYVLKIPVKTLRFVANYILTGMVIKEKLVYETFIEFNGILMEDKHVNQYFSSQYGTFSRLFADIDNKIKKTYGREYFKICSPKINKVNAEIDYMVSDKDKSRRISDSLANTLKHLLINRTAKVKDVEENEYTISFSDDKEYLQFLFTCVLYAIRNTTVHGNVAARFNSVRYNKETIKSSNFMYLLGHLFLSLCLYCNGDYDKNDLYINIENINLIS